MIGLFPCCDLPGSEANRRCARPHVAESVLKNQNDLKVVLEQGRQNRADKTGPAEQVH